MSIFLLTFFCIYGGTHLYFFLKVKGAFSLGLAATVTLAFFLLLMVIAPILVRILEKEGLETSARILAYAGYLWMGFLFLFFSASLAVDFYHGAIRLAGLVSHRDLSALFLTGKTSFILALVYGAVTALYGYFEALDIRTEQVYIATPKIPGSVGKLTVVQVSDVHLGLIVRKARLEKILARVKAASPDIMVSTGDLVDGQINRMTGLAEMLNEVSPRFGKFAVTGNHEIYAGLGPALAFTEKGGFRVLRGECAVAGGVINIVGVDDPVVERISGEPLAPEKILLERADRSRFTLFLKHRPAIERESVGLFDLQLSGHVHKGQIFPFNLVTYLFYPVKAGYSQCPRHSALYVSRGTGTWGPPIRFLSPPEVTIIELRSAAGPS